MSDISDWIQTELIPEIFNQVPEVFPEHNFKKFRQDWQSKTYLYGAEHKDRPDKTKITARVPGIIFEQGGDHIGIIDYVMKRDKLPFIDAVKKISDRVGLVLPAVEANQETFKKLAKKRNILSTTAEYFSYLLFTGDGRSVHEYLLNRGYADGEIKEMNLGFVPQLPRLLEYLKTKNFTEQEVRDTLRFPTAEGRQPGTSHTLSIPFLNNGTITGFKFRTIDENIKPKYINTAELPKNSGFFGLSYLKGDKDLIIVEGDLDSSFATIKGVENVVATAGSNINEEQVKEAIRFGAKKFTICFDSESTPEKILETTQKIVSAISVIRAVCDLKIYIAELPNQNRQKTDPDSFIRKYGVESFSAVIGQAIPAFLFLYNVILEKYTGRNLTSKDQDNLTDEVIELSSSLPADESVRILKEFRDGEVGKHLGLTEQVLLEARDRIISANILKSNKKEISGILSKAEEHLNKGDLEKSLKEITDGAKKVKQSGYTTQFNSLLVNPKEEDIIQRQSYKPVSLDMGFRLRDKENEIIPMMLPAGALSFVAAATSHGKTAVLVNTLLNLAENYPRKEFHLFSYEEDADDVMIRAINTHINADLTRNYYETNKDVIKEMLINPAYMANTQEAQKFKIGKDDFFVRYINSGRIKIHYVNYSSSTLDQAIRFLHANTNVGGILIDYMQLLHLDEFHPKRGASRQEQLKEICLELKNTAVDTGLPIFMGAQFNREVTNPLLMHPTKISEAGDIERIANMIIGIWYTNKKQIHKSEEIKKECAELIYPADQNKLYTVLLKNRDNITDVGSFLSFQGKTGKIKNI